MRSPHIAPAAVHATLARHMLADGYDMVLDLDKSQGRRLHDSRSGRSFLDLFSFFATLPIGFNHPKMKDPDFLAKLTRAALVNPTNSDIYSTEFAEFVEVFGRVAMRPHLPHAFFVAGGSLGVENALKAAMDWKVRQNFRKGVREEKGHQILHFREAFHGRSGYTVSMTNTADPRKHQYFAKFDWPRVSNPYLRFPVTDAELARVQQAESATLAEIRTAFAEREDDIAAVILEPIQAEGGDHHFRTEFLSALKGVAHEHDALLIFDEVQTGVGLTGSFWAHEALGVQPDLLAFGKKMQVCGMLGGGRLDEEPENVFKVSSRINSTWGGNLVDMVRGTHCLRLIEHEHLLENAARIGELFVKELRLLADEEPIISAVRGRGLMIAFDLPSRGLRDEFHRGLFGLGLLALRSGERSIRFRPALDLPAEAIGRAIEILNQQCRHMTERRG